MAVADWVLRHGEPAGRNTDTLPGAQLRYLPLKTGPGVIGVLGVQRNAEADGYLTPDQQRLMEAFASQAALPSSGRTWPSRRGRRRCCRPTEQLQTALLNSISHDLRTPLVSITGALSSLQEQEASARRGESARAGSRMPWTRPSGSTAWWATCWT